MPASCSAFTYPLTLFSRWTLGALDPQGALGGKTTHINRLFQVYLLWKECCEN